MTEKDKAGAVYSRKAHMSVHIGVFYSALFVLYCSYTDISRMDLNYSIG